ncbi:VanZ family protein [Microbacterium telephonicum]|uniref:VanZ family protein n=1 Tax=Microbacterium telephonicum TaxID=1714841 RepID=UPI0013144737|nr:VanZ family protein [Microbacterium telephonicum]
MPQFRRRIGIALIVYVLLAVALLLSPVGPGEIVERLTTLLQSFPGGGVVRQGWVEFAANILLFLPLGLLLTMLSGRPWVGMLLAVGLSVSAELIQTLLPNRVTSLRDIVANALGTLLGALIAWLIVRRHRPARPTETTRAR